jgi:hypothetical protein
MPTARATQTGVVVDFSNLEVTRITNVLNVGGGFAALATAIGLTTAPLSVFIAIVAAVLGIGSASLSACNSQQKGIELTIMWIGVPWCKSK